MVIHENNDGPPVELSIIKKTMCEDSRHITANSFQEMSNKCCGCQLSEEEEERVKDFEELRQLYLKCKAVIKKIETKYGSLISNNKTCRKHRIQQDSDESECQCEVNKKIVYDDDGNQMEVDSTLENHICPKKRKVTKHSCEQYERINQVQIDYSDIDLQLPDDLSELASMLKSPDLNVVTRYRVLDKIRTMRQDYTNEIRFNKQAIIEKLKTDPDEVLGFKGTNLSSLSGYS